MSRTHKGKHLFIWSKEVYRNCLKKKDKNFKKIFLCFLAVSALQAVTNFRRGTTGKQ